MQYHTVCGFLVGTAVSHLVDLPRLSLNIRFPFAELISWCIPPNSECAIYQRKVFERAFFSDMS